LFAVPDLLPSTLKVYICHGKDSGHHECNKNYRPYSYHLPAALDYSCVPLWAWVGEKLPNNNKQTNNNHNNNNKSNSKMWLIFVTW